MKVDTGRSFLTDAHLAVAEATSSFDGDAGSPSFVLAFCSTKQDPAGVARALTQRFPTTPIAGCTTTGELLDGAHSNGSLVVAAIHSPELRWAKTRMDGLASFDGAQAEAAIDRLFASLGVDRDRYDPDAYFCLMLIDGLCKKEEVVAAAVADALGGIQLVGGSAGDDLAFRSTRVIDGPEALSGSAVLILGHGPGAFQLLKHQHFTRRPLPLAVTRVDTEARRIYELDGYPAADAYAWALGLTREQLDADVTFMNPVTFSVNGEIYVRSIQRLEDDGSMVFYCGVEEGAVLEVGGHDDMVEELRTAAGRTLASFGRAELLISCNCILRSLEAEKSGLHDQLGSVLRSVAKSSIGFDTYGEQLNGLHINQTVVALALKSGA